MTLVFVNSSSPQRKTVILKRREVPSLPCDVKRRVGYKDVTVYDGFDHGDPCRWRFDRRGLVKFIRYVPEPERVVGEPVKEVWERKHDHYD